jgi:uncharacterized protein (DUF305 family)
MAQTHVEDGQYQPAFDLADIAKSQNAEIETMEGLLSNS